MNNIHTPKPSLPARSSSSRGWDWTDTIILLLCLVFSALYYLGRIQPDFPLVLLGGDSANITSFAAAFDNPQVFKNDALLNNLDNVRIYMTVHIPYIRWLAPVMGNYSLAYLTLLGPMVFLQLLGYYLLGKSIFHSRAWALVFMALNTIPLSFVLQESWGLSNVPTPRNTFQSLLPYVLLLALRWRAYPLRWPLVMGLAGLLVYIHPVSTPAWLAALWLGFLVLLPPGWVLWRKAAMMILLGFSAVIVISPFVVNYLTYHEQGKVLNYPLLMLVLRNFFPEHLLDVPAALGIFARDMTRMLLLPGALVAGVYLWLRRVDREKVKLVGAWLAGVFLISVFVPALERLLERLLDIAPLETELMRGLRYLAFFLLIFVIWFLADMSRQIRSPWLRVAPVALCGVLSLSMLISPNASLDNYRYVGDGLSCISKGKLLCSAPSDMTDLITAIQVQTPPDSLLYFSRNAYDTSTLVVRYLALRSLAYNFKDRGLLAYSNAQDLAAWYDTFQEVDRYKNDKVWLTRNPQEFIDFIRKHKIDFLVLSEPVSLEKIHAIGASLVFEGGPYMLLDTRMTQNSDVK